MNTGNVIEIDFFVLDTLPNTFKEIIEKEDKKIDNGIIVVKTFDSSPPSYQIDFIGSRPEQIQDFMHKLAKEDGSDLNEAIKRAFSEPE